MPFQYTHVLARSLLFSIPWCPAWMFCRMQLLMVVGISTRSPFSTSPSSTESSSLHDQNSRRFLGSCLALSGQPSMMMLLMVGFWLKLQLLHQWTELRILTVQGESLCQGWDWGVRGYLRVPSLCQDGIWCWRHSAVDAATSAVDVGECWQGFSCGSSPGVCGQSQPQRVFRRCMCGSVHSRKRQPGVHIRCWHTTGRSVRALLAKAIGHPSWRRAALIPIFDVSTWMVVGLVMSKYVRVMSLQLEALTFSKTCRELCSTQMVHPSWSELSEGQFGLQAWGWMEPWTGLCQEIAEFLWHSLEWVLLGFQRTFLGQDACH